MQMVIFAANKEKSSKVEMCGLHRKSTICNIVVKDKICVTSEIPRHESLMMMNTCSLMVVGVT